MKDIRELEGLAKIELTEEERLKLQKAGGALLASFEALGSIDTRGVEPLVSVLNLTNVLREDVAAKMISREELLSNAPEQYDGYFQAPKTLE